MRGIRVTGVPDINLNCFLSYFESPIHHSAFPLQAKINGQLTFEGSVLRNLDRCCVLNFHGLKLVFKRSLFKGELKWMRNNPNLESLELIRHKNMHGKLRTSSIKEIEEVFAGDLVTLKTLKLENDIFDTIRVFQWSQYFSNLRKLYISYSRITPEYFIAEYFIADLTVLEHLTHIWFKSLPNLMDEAFTLICGNRFAPSSNHKQSVTPAIAGFKLLKFLNINDCPQLTNWCVIKGIVECRTLESLTIANCYNITEKCLDMIAGFGRCWTMHRFENALPAVSWSVKPKSRHLLQVKYELDPGQATATELMNSESYDNEEATLAEVKQELIPGPSSGLRIKLEPGSESEDESF